MGVSPIVQPINTTILANQIEKSGLHCTHPCATQSIAYKYFQIKKKTQGYTALMDVPPKIQPINAKVITNHIQNSGLHCTHGCVTESTAYKYYNTKQII